MSSFKKIAWSGSAVLLALVMSMGLMVQSAFAANEAAAAVTITRASNTAAATTTYTVTFTNGTVGGANNTVLVAGDTITVDLTGAGGAAEMRTAGGTAFTPVGGFAGGCVGTAVGTGADLSVLVITLAGTCNVANDAIGVSFTLSNIINGAVAAAASLGTLATNGAVDDVTATAATNTVATVAAAATAVTNVNFAGTSQSPSVATTWTQTFTATTALAAGGTITTVFPAGFVIPNPPATTLTGFGTCTGTSVTTGQSVVTTLGAGCTLAAGAVGTVALAGIVNPVAGTYAAAGFTEATSADTTPVANSAAEVIGTGTTTTGCAPMCVDAMVLVPAGTTCNQAAIVAGSRPGTSVADGSVAQLMCLHVARASTNNIDAPAAFAEINSTPAVGAVVNVTVSLGIVGTGTAKTVTIITNATGYASTNYRGGGNQVSTDTIIAAVQGPDSAVGTLTVNLVASSGNTASKMVFNAPTVLAVAATITNTSPNYMSPTVSTNISLKVSDSAGLGVNGEQILISTDKGSLQAGFNAACGTTKALTQATAFLAPAVGATVESGIVQLTYCANQLDAPGKATITAQNVSTSMANVTTSISMAGRPNKLEATVTGAAIAVKVTDAGGNAVADGTPVRFTISSNAGAVSTACTTTTNGAASAVAALVANAGLVIISTDWNETGAAATCAAAGAQQIAQSVNVSGGTASTGGTPGGTTGTQPGGTGQLVSGSCPASGFGLIVFGGGTIAQLVTASGVGNTGALYATVGGIFVPYVPGTTISAVNAEFLAAYPGGNIPANTAFVCRR